MCPGETVTCTCATGNTNALAWIIDGSRIEFTSSDPLLTRRTVSRSNASAVVTENSDRNGVRVIMSSLTVSARMTSMIILTCENVGQTVTNLSLFPTLVSAFIVLRVYIEDWSDWQSFSWHGSRGHASSFSCS